MHTAQPATGFHSLGLSSQILTVLDKKGFTVPTPIQAQAIPACLEGKDVIGIAQTGTGKTMAFGLPTLQRLSGSQDKGLILVPTRELALQVEENLRLIGQGMYPAVRTVVLIGGAPMYRQVKDLQRNPQIIIATPGRLVDHLQQGRLKLDRVQVLILDEADRMFDMGFAPQIKQVLTYVPAKRQTLLFSATMSPEVRALTTHYQVNPVKIEVAPTSTPSAQIAQEICYVAQHEKFTILQRLLTEYPQTVLVFTRTKHGAAKLTIQLRAAGHTAAEIHSNRSLGQRRQALDGFKNGMHRILVATDIAARGIDVKDIQLVVNYDLPDATEDYVHRIGRTGRAGTNGVAISLACMDQQRDVAAIERIMKKTLPLSSHSLPVQQRSFGHSGGRGASRTRPHFEQRSVRRPMARSRFR